jgi:hypothetical protein
MGLKQHSFLGNGRETNNGTTSVARQQILNKQQLIIGRGISVFCAVRADMLKPGRFGATSSMLGRKSVCEEKTRRLVRNGRQSGSAQLEVNL